MDEVRNGVRRIVRGLRRTDSRPEAALGLPSVDGDALQAAAARNDARVRAARDRLYATALDPDQAAEQLGLPPADVAALIDRGHLLTIDGPDGAPLPNWQKLLWMSSGDLVDARFGEPGVDAGRSGGAASRTTRWISVSSTRAYLQCPRRYWYGSIARVPKDRPVPPSWRVGSAVHAALEAAYRHQAAAPSGRLSDGLTAARTALSSAWHRHELHGTDRSYALAARWVHRTLHADVLRTSDVLGVEEPLRDTSTERHRIIGFADLLLGRGADVIEVVDHKVTRRQAAEREVADDLQLNLYGALVQHRWGDRVQVRGTLHYPVVPSAVTVTLSAAGMQAARDQVCEVADRARADEVYEPVPGDHCGSCPWQLRCPAG